MSSKTFEDYLKAISILSSNGKTVTTTEISRHFKIAPASVTEMLKKLAEKEYIDIFTLSRKHSHSQRPSDRGESNTKTQTARKIPL